MSGIALYGGTFNPPHNGHVSVIKKIHKIDFIGKIVLTPNAKPPHKEAPESSTDHRILMTKRVVSELQKDHIPVEYFDFEIKQGGLSYTINTVNELKRLNKTAEVYLVIGTDSYFQFHKWKMYGELLQKVKLIVVNREKETKQDYSQYWASFLSEIPFEDITFIDEDPIECSSSEIRKSVQEKLAITHVVPSYIAEFIVQNKLYI